MVVDDYKFVLHGNVGWKKLLSQTKYLKFAKVKAKLMDFMKSLNYFFVLVCFLLYDD